MSGAPNRWIDLSIGGGVSVSGKTIQILALGHGQPSQLILPADATGAYPGLNASTFNFTPIVDGAATFTLPFTGVTSSTTITAVTFGFGTGPDHTLSGDNSGSCPNGASDFPVCSSVGTHSGDRCRSRHRSPCSASACSGLVS